MDALREGGRLESVQQMEATAMKGLSVQVEEDGVWLLFESSSRKSAKVTLKSKVFDG